MKKYFEVGQTVYALNYGKGEVISTNKTEHYPIFVQFYLSDHLYCNDGRFHENDLSPSLFQTAPIITPNVPISEFTKGELVLVRDWGEWFVRYYSHFKSGEHWCFNNQRKVGYTQCWKEIIKLTDNLILPNKTL